MIRTIIVENEPHIAEMLQSLLSRHFNDIEVLDVCDSVETSLEAINIHNPELVFLDVELNYGETAFDILRNLASIDFKIIFTTAYNQYAIQAIKFSALDYLLKPIDEDELKTAVQKFASERNTTSPAQHQALMNYQPGNQNAKLGLPELNEVIYVRVSNILYCQGQSAQSFVHLTDGSKRLISRTLKDFEEMLTPFHFCRVHKSYLVNLQHIAKYHKGDGGYIMLDDGSHLDVSKSYRDDLLSKLRRI